MRSSIDLQVQKVHDWSNLICSLAVCTNKGGHTEMHSRTNSAKRRAFREASSAGHRASSEARDDVCRFDQGLYIIFQKDNV